MHKRLLSLDVLRGLDMILLTAVGPLVWSAQASWSCFPDGFAAQFEHGWIGFTLWDLVMPLFIFMCGAAIPLALEKRLADGKGAYWRHVLGRVAMLWALGGVLDGGWLAFDPLEFSPFSNTLQAIAVGYLAVAATMTFRSRVLDVVVPVALAVGYSALLAFGGDYTEFGNFAFKVDHAVFGAILPSASTILAAPSHYTWLLTSAMFAVMTFAGYHATRILKSEGSPRDRLVRLAGYGAILLALGFFVEIRIPCIKPIFTLSFVLEAAGWCALALAALYLVHDVLGFSRGLAPVLLFGRAALTAYVVYEFFFWSVLKAGAHRFGDGLVALLPESAADFVLTLISVAELVVIVRFWTLLRARSRSAS